MEFQNFIRNNNKSNITNDNKIIYNLYKNILFKFSLLNLKKKYLYNFLIINLILLIIFSTFIISNDNIKYNNYIKNCKKLKRFNITKIINNEAPYLSVCIPVYNMEKYLERCLLSIINQSFQNFEIIIVNDNSKDNSQKILQQFQLEDKRIKIINHSQNLGVYSSRVDAVLNAKGKYIILMDPDDMFLNPNLFEKLFNINLKLNLDIIEFTVKYQEDGKNNIFKPESHELNHYHDYGKNIIYQPELSNIIFYIPKTKKYSSIICRTIWNKIIKNNILLKALNYIDIDFNNKYLITADDTPINMVILQIANNFSNIDLPGYLYNLRINSMSRGNNGIKHDIIVSINYLLFYKLFYRYIKDYNKDLNYLFYDMKLGYSYLLNIKEYKLNEYLPIFSSFINMIVKNKNISREFKEFLNNILIDRNIKQ